MKLSPLQLSSYFITELHLAAIPKFDRTKPVEITDQHFFVEPAFKRIEDGLQWQVSLRLRQDPAPNANVPYSFAVVIVGFFEVHPQFEKERIERMVQTNAPTVLYSILREVVRDLTTRGPHLGLMLPTISFSPDSPMPELAAKPL
jgi:preprotein translocase subunit SecB